MSIHDYTKAATFPSLSLSTQEPKTLFAKRLISALAIGKRGVASTLSSSNGPLKSLAAQFTGNTWAADGHTVVTRWQSVWFSIIQVMRGAPSLGLLQALAWLPSTGHPPSILWAVSISSATSHGTHQDQIIFSCPTPLTFSIFFIILLLS